MPWPPCGVALRPGRAAPTRFFGAGDARFAPPSPRSDDGFCAAGLSPKFGRLLKAGLLPNDGLPPRAGLSPNAGLPLRAGLSPNDALPLRAGLSPNDGLPLRAGRA